MKDGFYFMQRKGPDARLIDGWHLVSAVNGTNANGEPVLNLYVHFPDRLGERPDLGHWALETAQPVEPPEGGWGAV